MSTLTEQAEGPRAAILTVDDDPAVSRAVARDLRRRYGDQYRNRERHVCSSVCNVRLKRQLKRAQGWVRLPLSGRPPPRGQPGCGPSPAARPPHR